MNSEVLLLSAVLTFASWVDAVPSEPTFPDADQKCTEETYSGNNGTIDFPGEGDDYKCEQSCLFTISVPEDHFVQFSFSQFDFEVAEDGKKCYDWLVFSDGIGETDDMTKFCNNGPDPSTTFFSSSNEITFWFYSDSEKNGKGFKLDWTAVEQECDCNADGTEDCQKKTEICKCKLGYEGARCDQCTEGYWNSTDSTTKCEKCDECDCKGNKIGSCDKKNGKCVCECKAGYEGETCQDCKEDYWLSSGECKACDECDCKKNQIGSCDITNGKCVCKCKAGYEGKDCNDCEENYWLSSGECKACNVCGCKGNKIGSCDKTNGKCVCKCKAGYKGAKCDECVDDYWMSSSECKKCETCDEKCEENQTGSCDQSNGKCKCSSAATFFFDKTIVFFTTVLISFSHKF